MIFRPTTINAINALMTIVNFSINKPTCIILCTVLVYVRLGLLLLLQTVEEILIQTVCLKIVGAPLQNSSTMILPHTPVCTDLIQYILVLKRFVCVSDVL